MTESETFLDGLVGALVSAGSFNRLDQVEPAAVLWPDEERAWEPLLRRLRERLPVVTVGTYAPDERCGPPAWVRCVVARTLAETRSPTLCSLSEGLPVVYLPGVSAEELRDTSRCPPQRELLAELRYRSALWLQPDGREWTPAAFLERRGSGLGVELRTDTETRAALDRALVRLADKPVAELRQNAPWRASDFDALLGFPDAVQEPDVRELIALGESSRLEFKDSARWDARQGKTGGVMQAMMVKTVAAFLNAEGGTLLIGVADDRSVPGLETDYQGLAGDRRDKYELWLMQTLMSAFGREFVPFVRATFHEVDGRDICKVAVAPAPEPTFAKEARNAEAFYVRMGNQTQSLTMREAYRYIKQHWS